MKKIMKIMENPKKKLLSMISLSVIIILTIMPLFFLHRAQPQVDCSIFTVSKGEKVFYANNEDGGLDPSRVLFIPESENKYGRVFFGHLLGDNSFIVRGGINEMGLSADTNGVYEGTEINKSSEREDVNGVFIHTIMERFASVEEVINWSRDKDLICLERFQIHIADKTGDGAILSVGEDGELFVTRKIGDYLISTNYNVALGEGECHRYDSIEGMIQKINSPEELTIEKCASILSEVQQRTIYSNINDLTEGIIYLFSKGDFSRYAVLNISEELTKGRHFYDIETLVSNQSGEKSETLYYSEIFGWMIIAFLSTIYALILYMKKGRGSNTNSERICFIERKEEGYQKGKKKVKENPKIILICSVFLFILFFSLMRVPFTLLSMPFPITVIFYAIFYLSFASIISYLGGILFTPLSSFLLVSLSSLVAFLVSQLIVGVGSAFPVHIFHATFIEGITAFIISALKRKHIALSLIIGVLSKTFLSFLVFLGWSHFWFPSRSGLLMVLLWTLIQMMLELCILVPITFVAILVLRRIFILNLKVK